MLISNQSIKNCYVQKGLRKLRTRFSIKVVVICCQSSDGFYSTAPPAILQLPCSVDVLVGMRIFSGAWCLIYLCRCNTNTTHNQTKNPNTKGPVYVPRTTIKASLPFNTQPSSKILLIITCNFLCNKKEKFSDTKQINIQLCLPIFFNIFFISISYLIHSPSPF